MSKYKKKLKKFQYNNVSCRINNVLFTKLGTPNNTG